MEYSSLVPELASSVNLYRFTHFYKITYGLFCKNCSLGQHPQSPSNTILQWWLLAHSERFRKCNFWTIWTEVKIKFSKNYFDAPVTNSWLNEKVTSTPHPRSAFGEVPIVQETTIPSKQSIIGER